ncbi:hypothetical protein LIER_15487 [Lithospermum erythrorhizon]|uniref:Uncharacterized protein n=1 Tax=Lithospermum erythrorhizon TaxID=34254 RepID=A0AAV3Q5M0_LITER
MGRPRSFIEKELGVGGAYITDCLLTKPSWQALPIRKKMPHFESHLHRSVVNRGLYEVRSSGLRPNQHRSRHEKRVWHFRYLRTVKVTTDV